MISVCLFILEEKTERRIPMNFMEKLLKVYHNCACFARTNFVKTSSAVIFFRRISCLHEKMPGKAPIERHLMSKK